jgi:hypothetical protein
MKVWSEGSVTMVGYGGPFPRPKGNCFGLHTKRCRKYFRIVNFGYENFRELFKRKILSWPVTIEVIEYNEERKLGRAIIKDDRIPEEWYTKEWCTVCCPDNLIPKENKHMPKIAEVYKNKISLIVIDTIKNYVASDRDPEDKLFKEWLDQKAIYYANRITNTVVSMKPSEKAQAVGYIAIEIYKIKERDYDTRTT